jgi:hypothetical protein
MSGQDSVTSKELVSELRKCGMEGDRYYNRLCAWAAERIQDLQQFHDWAEPQITDLNRTAHEPCDALLEHGTASDEAIVLLLRYRDLLGQCDCDPRDADRECNYCRTVSLLAHLGVAEYAEHPDYRASGASPPPSNEVIAAAARVANEIELHDDDDPFRDDLRLLVATVRASQPPSAEPFGFVAAMTVADSVFEQYRRDQPKWWKRMDGTPILNDVAVRMAQAFLEATQCTGPTKPAALSPEEEAERDWQHAEPTDDDATRIFGGPPPDSDATKPETHIFCMGCKQPVPEGHECPSLGERGE